MKRQGLIAGFAALVALGCGGQKGASATVRVDGSSTVFPIMEAAAEDYQKAGGGNRVTVGVSGTGGGFKKLCAGEIDIADASRPIKKSEEEACAAKGIELVELPIAYDGIAVVVHPKNDWAKELGVADLKRMWEPEAQKKVLRWNDVRAEFPERELHLFGAGVDSGTYDYFTEAIVGKEHASRGDFTSSEDDNVLVQGIAGDEAALGFFGLAYFEANKEKVKLVPIDDGKPDNGAGPILPIEATVRDGTYQPLSRPLFVYASKKALERPEVEAFSRFVLEHAADLVKATGYVPLPARAYELAGERLAARRTGSMFSGGSQVGVSLEDLLAREGAAK